LAKDKKLQGSAGETSVLVGNLGRRVLVFNDNEVVALLWAAVKREGGQSSFAKRHGVERGRLNRTLGGKLPVGRAVAKALGLRRVYTAE